MSSGSSGAVASAATGAAPAPAPAASSSSVSSASSVTAPGAATPRGTSMTPPPGHHNASNVADTASSTPSPLTVGTRFVKQYYKVLTTEPDQIFRFYQPSVSVLSQGIGSQPTQPKLFESADQAGQELKDRFALEESQENYKTIVRFEFEHGAIDAQVSVNNGVLLVVTGHAVYENSKSSADEAAESTVRNGDEQDFFQRRRAFVHTFFLGSHMSGTKRSYYVHNDILRFLHYDDKKTDAVSNQSHDVPDSEVSTPVATTSDDLKEDIVHLPVVEEPPSKTISESAVEDSNDNEIEAPGGGVEETKELMPDEDELLEDEALNKEEDDDVKQDEVESSEGLPAANQVPSFVNEEVIEAVGDNILLESAVALDESVVAKNSESVGSRKKSSSLSDEAINEVNDVGKPSFTTPSVAASPAPQPAASKPVPGSWASLVAGSKSTVASTGNATAANSSGSVPTTGTSARSMSNATSTASPSMTGPNLVNSVSGGKMEGAKESISNDAGGANTDRAPSTTSAVGGAGTVGVSSTPLRPQHNKRDPDCTLVIRNIDSNTKQKDILELFERFATKTETKVVGTTVSTHKAIAFVDYDSPLPVLAALEQHERENFQINGRLLDIYQKTLESRGRRPQSRGGGATGAVAGNVGANSGTGSGGIRGTSGGGQQSSSGDGSSRSGGGRQQYRRGGRDHRSGSGGGGGGSSGGGRTVRGGR